MSEDKIQVENLREISITKSYMNNSVTVNSSFEKDTLNVIKKMVLEILNEIDKEKNHE